MIEYFEEKSKRKYWDSFQHAFLGVSMLNPNFNGEKFEQMIAWLNKQKNIKHCFIYLADSLYRHHFMMQDDLNEEDAYKKAIYFGDKWLTKHSKYFDKIKVPHRVIRWDEHWQNPYLRVVQEIFNNEYEQNSAFQSAIKKDIEDLFARRGIEINHILPKELAFCRNYLLEELAVDSLFFQKYKIARIYPGKELRCYTYLRTKEEKEFAASFKNFYHVRLLAREVEGLEIKSSKKAA